MKLENTVVGLAKQRLLELQFFVNNFDETEDDNLQNVDYTIHLSRLFQLVEFGLIVDSGMSDKGIEELREIEISMNLIINK